MCLICPVQHAVHVPPPDVMGSPSRDSSLSFQEEGHRFSQRSAIFSLLFPTFRVNFPLFYESKSEISGWLASLQENNNTLPIGLVKLPFNSFLQLSEFFYVTMIR